MTKGVDHFFCSEQYHISDTVRHKLVEKQNCSDFCIRMYNWSESWFHMNGPVKEVNSIALKNINGGFKSHCSQLDQKPRNFCRCIGIGIKEVVGCLLTVPAFIIRAYGRYHYIQAEADSQTPNQEFETFLKQDDLQVSDLYDFRILIGQTPDNFYEKVTELLLKSDYRHIPSDIHKFTPEQQVKIFKHFFIKGNQLDAELFTSSTAASYMWGDTLRPYQEDLKTYILDNLGKQQWTHTTLREMGVSLLDVLNKVPKDHFNLWISEFWNKHATLLDPVEVKEVLNFLVDKNEVRLLEVWCSKPCVACSLDDEYFNSLLNKPLLKGKKETILNNLTAQAQKSKAEKAAPSQGKPSPAQVAVDINTLGITAIELQKYKGVQKIDDHTFVILDPDQLPEQWQAAVGKIRELAEGKFVKFYIAPKIKFTEQGIKLGYRGVKAPSIVEEQRLDNVLQALGPDDLDHVEKPQKVESSPFFSVKYFKKGDAAKLPPVNKSTPPAELQQRCAILLQAAQGAQELKKKGFYHLDFKLENIFYTIKKDGAVKAVLGDLGGLLYLPDQWNKEKFQKHYHGIIHTIRSVNFENLAGRVDALKECPEVMNEGSYDKTKALAEKELCFQIWAQGFRWFAESKNPEIVALLEELRTATTLEQSIAALQKIHLVADTESPPPSPSSRSATTQSEDE